MQQSLSKWRIVLAVSAVAVAAGPAASRANADEWNKRTVLTVNQPIQVRETLLQPGQYVLQLLSSTSDRHVVEIFNADRSHIIGTVIAIPRERTQATGDSQFSFWETPPGTAKALRTWFYPGDTIGQEFPYPKQTHQLAMLEKPAPEPAPATTTSSVATQPETPPPPPPPAPPTAATAPNPEPAQTDQAEAAPPQQPATPSQTPPAAAPPTPQDTSPQPAELPKTGSRYPLLGLGGIMFLGLAGLLRLRRPGIE